MAYKDGSRQKVSEEEIERALRECNGFVSNAARMLKVNRRTLFNYFQHSPRLKEVLEEERGVFLDIAELKLLELVRAGKERPLIFFLRTKGKHRGYTYKPDPNPFAGLTDRELYHRLKPMYEELHAIYGNPDGDGLMETAKDDRPTLSLAIG